MKKKIVKKSINIPNHLVKRIEKSIEAYPGLNFTLIVNQALEQWLNGNQQINLSAPTFINDNSKGFGPKAKK
ncbi:MAG: hypothetical protein QF441_09465 [Bacteriovoracaceae bacterium]|jgi:hypothetical protein|nr:hypothetical protein [Halobacteriovoraceae bacterium]MDP7320824.1 hypothetical protein [Bacteriovoracaceae bacterium]